MNTEEIKQTLLNFRRKLDNWIGHQNCYICHQSSHLLVCDYCLNDADMEIFPSPGHNLLDLPKVYENLTTPEYEGLYALGNYNGILKGLINQLKFSRKPIVAQVIAEFFTLYLRKRMEISQVIPQGLVPIPLSDIRHIKRQYNQSRLLSQALGNKFSIDTIDALKRVRHTKQQARLNKQMRQMNIQNAFALAMPINVRSIAIVDDVITTGATINEACNTIRQQYPEISISVWCMAVTTL